MAACGLAAECGPAMTPACRGGIVHDLDIERFDGSADLAASYAIRRRVFIEEQGVAEALEIDGRDRGAVHYLVRRDGRAIATARVRDLAPGVLKVERVAVLVEARHAGIGRCLMARIIADAMADGARRIELSAQAYVERFYADLGFARDGPVFEEAGMPHVHMHRDL
ncbi:MAG: GNAT family N-acetyltransferase [Alphaproteobacteria bacterium]|nr:GNAT family N-acetyltransferase [Alphaproteobacteria bacterium]